MTSFPAPELWFVERLDSVRPTRNGDDVKSSCESELVVHGYQNLPDHRERLAPDANTRGCTTDARGVGNSSPLARFPVHAAGNALPTMAMIDEPEASEAATEGSSVEAHARELSLISFLSSDLVCGGCGYAIAVYVSPPNCPMCKERNWKPAPKPSIRPL